MKERICLPAVKHLWIAVKFISVNTNLTGKNGYLRGHRSEGTNIAYKYKIFVAVKHFMDISILYRYTCVYNFKSYWNKWGKGKIPAKQGRHNW